MLLTFVAKRTAKFASKKKRATILGTSGSGKVDTSCCLYFNIYLFKNGAGARHNCYFESVIAAVTTTYNFAVVAGPL